MSDFSITNFKRAVQVAPTDAARAKLLGDALGLHRQNQAALFVIATHTHSFLLNSKYGWDAGLWGVLKDTLDSVVLKPAMPDTAGTAESLVAGMGAMLKYSRPHDVPSADISQLAAYVKNPAVPFSLRHDICREPLRELIGIQHDNAHENPPHKGIAGYLRDDSMAAVPEYQRTGQLDTVAPDMHVLPRYKSGYWFPIFMLFDSDERLLCNSRCQFGAPEDIIDYWTREGELKWFYKPEMRSRYGVPAVFNAMRLLREQPTTTKRRRHAINRSLLKSLALLRERAPVVYEQTKPHLPQSLQRGLPLFERKQAALLAGQRVGIA